MSVPADYSTWNMESSLADHLATGLIAAGWLIYWYARDAVEVPGAFVYPSWMSQHAIYEADSTFAAALAASKGIITLRSAVPANPVFITRLTNDGLEGKYESVSLPTIALELMPERQIRLWELGTRMWLRSRRALLFGYVRNREEQVLVADALQGILEQERLVTIIEHVGGTGSTIGDAILAQTEIDTDLVYDKSEAEALTVDVTLRLDYIV